MKKIILFDIDYTLSDRDYLKNFGRKYLADLVGHTVKEINSTVDKIIIKSVKKYGIFNIYFYAKEISKEYKDKYLEKKIIDMFLKYYPFDAALYPEVKQVLEELKSKYILGIQSDGQKIFQLKKIEPIIKYFCKEYVYIFTNKTDEIYSIINKFQKQAIIIDDKPDHVNNLSKNGVKAFLINRGPYAEKYSQNKNKYLSIKNVIINLSDSIPLLV